MSSITNAAMSVYVARSLGAVQFGSFGLAYVTYPFALNASRGLATDPLQVRFSDANVVDWRRAVASCTGTASVVGLAAGALALGAARLLDGTAMLAFLALGLTLPGLLLQDSWRYSFFVLGRGSQAFLNDAIWAALLVPALVLLRMTGHGNVFWFVLAWGASASVAAFAGPLQAKVLPRLPHAWTWVSQHRDLAPRYLAEETLGSGAGQLRAYGVGLIVGLAAVGYIQAALTLMGPFMVIFMGISLVTVPEAVRVLRRSPQHLLRYCALVGGGPALLALSWGLVLLVALPRGLGHWLLDQTWHGTYPLVLPMTLGIMGSCVSAGATAGLHAMGSARRSLRTELIASIAFVAAALLGAAAGGAPGAVRATAVAVWAGALLWWWQLRDALQETGSLPGRHPVPAAGAGAAVPLAAAPRSRSWRGRYRAPASTPAERASGPPPQFSPSPKPRTHEIFRISHDVDSIGAN